jgi:molybdenum cofactor cytidylyltransferase
MRGRNKLLERIDGAPVIAHVVRTVLAAGAEPVIVVTGHEEVEVRGALQGEPVELVGNPRWSDGMSTSLATGVSALGDRVDGALICLGDMPRVTAADLHGLVRAFGDSAPEYAPACVPVHGGRQGNPVLWSRDRFEDLRTISGDRGAKALLGALGDRIVRVPSGAGVLMDADTPAAFELLRGEDR